MWVFATPDSDRCVVRLLDTYISKLPTSPRAFYLRPLTSVPSSGPWYGQAVVGVNTLKKIVPELCQEACFGVQYTNHSLRATAITRMYEGGVPENIISEKSGHKSIKGLRAYERTSILQEKAAGASINAKQASCIEHDVDKKQVSPSEQVAKDEQDVDKKQVSPSEQVPQLPKNGMPNFTGLQNCTFNFYSA